MAGSLEDLTSMITKVAQSAMKYCVPRLGIVKDVNDAQQKGRVLVLVPTLGWLTNDQGAWCYPKDKRAIITPKVDDYVIVEFVNGNRNLPVYSGIATQMKDMIPKSYDGIPTTQILFEDNQQELVFKYDEITKELIVEDGTGTNIMTINVPALTINLLSGAEAFVKGDVLDSWLSTLVSSFNNHIHTGVSSGGSTSGTPATPISGPSGHLSTTIKGE